jgi:hypothetical protein
VWEVATDQSLREAEHNSWSVLAAAGGGFDVLIGPFAGSRGDPWGKALRMLERITWVMAAGSLSEVGTGGGGS